MSDIIEFKNLDDLLIAYEMLPSKYEKFYITKFDNVPETSLSGMGPYHHPFFEIIIADNLNTSVSIGDAKFNTLESNLSFSSPGQLISWQYLGDTPASNGYQILFHSEFIPSSRGKFIFYQEYPFFNINSTPNYHLKGQQLELVMALCNTIFQEFSAPKHLSYQLIQSYLTVLLIKLSQIFHQNTDSRSISNRAEDITFQFENLVKQARNKRQKLSTYSSALNISTIYLSECVKKTTGKTAKQITSEYLILEAKALLTQSNQGIKEIAYQLGFDEPTNFVKFFKKQSGTTPKKYRKKP